ncbi:MAG: glycine cleavage system protein GcvH [Candidatus Bipolaricaulota bacterium]
MTPKDRKYTKDHEWVLQDGDKVLVGITDHAQKQLGDIVFVELPEQGAKVSRGEKLVTVESVKAVGEVFAPVSGEVVEVNDALEANPDLINKSPYEDGWTAGIRMDDPSELEELLDAAEYEKLTEEG